MRVRGTLKGSSYSSLVGTENAGGGGDGLGGAEEECVKVEDEGEGVEWVEEEGVAVEGVTEEGGAEEVAAEEGEEAEEGVVETGDVEKKEDSEDGGVNV